ncbi:AAA family ATPase [Pseudomonas veronii]|uniref:AAA family ATPase n=1 Tax=Pseudomonas veronii TaxID=76761 RepID=UPI002D7672BE|nr:AAA family ATPase [Pseudomonas veronii]WRU62663.1 AAA family ATPase [Pseudomonas veronii]
MQKNVTSISKLEIEKFRALSDINIDFGQRITVICGKNGTAKSSILGIIAQIFSFSTDYVKKVKLPHTTLTGAPYKSFPGEHFRLSKTYDVTGSMKTTIHLYDGYTNQPATMQLRIYDYKDRPDPRPVVRNNKTIPGTNTSRNPTHPVIYLSLKRLTPITQRDGYEPYNLQYLNDNMGDFISLNQELLNKRGISRATATTGDIKSAAAFGENYDQDAVSAGEDNAGQLMLALLSFKKLKDEYADYKGGILLIDEADAGLFPAAQLALIKILTRETKKLNIQVIMTTHSPLIIEEIYKLSTLDHKSYKTIYLSDTHGPIERRENISWAEIYSDILTKTIEIDDDKYLPKINVYYEDREAVDFFDAIVTKRQLRKVMSPLKEVNLGCKSYLSLIDHKIPEFFTKSIIVLDADAHGADVNSTVVLLPGALPPDQLLFEFLYNLHDNDPYWKNKIKFTKPVFRKAAAALTRRLNLTAPTINLLDEIKKDSLIKNQPPIREAFKNFYKDVDIQKAIHGKAEYNPFRAWARANKDDCEKFLTGLVLKIKTVMIKGHGIDSAMLAYLDE